VFKSGNSEGEMTSIKEGCHPELVEGARRGPTRYASTGSA